MKAGCGPTSQIFVIETHQLIKIFHDRKRPEGASAVDGINLRCEPGRIYGLLGANGAGKTTTLRLLATLLKPSSGTVWVAGCDAIREPDKVHPAAAGEQVSRDCARLRDQTWGRGEMLLMNRCLMTGLLWR